MFMSKQKTNLLLEEIDLRMTQIMDVIRGNNLLNFEYIHKKKKVKDGIFQIEKKVANQESKLGSFTFLTIEKLSIMGLCHEKPANFAVKFLTPQRRQEFICSFSFQIEAFKFKTLF